MAEDAVRYVVEFQTAPGSWMRTQETEEYVRAADAEMVLHKAGIVARVIETTAHERYVSRWD